MRYLLLMFCLAACTQPNSGEGADAGSAGPMDPPPPPEAPRDAYIPPPDAAPPGEPPVDPPMEPPEDPPEDPPMDPPEDPPMDPPPPQVDECADAGAACDVCTCRLCADPLAACAEDPLCQAVVDCARETGCAGIECLQPCAEPIQAAGGPFSESVGRASAVSDCRDSQCGTDEAQCAEADPGPPEPPMDPEDPPMDPEDPPPPPPPVDECADAGGACDVCACRLCADALDTCFADPACEALVECAQRTGCDGVACLGPCGMEIQEAGGPFSESVARATAVSECRQRSCGRDDDQCVDNDPGPPDAPMDPPDPEDPPPMDPEDPPPVEGCGRFQADEQCSMGTNADGTEWCEFYVRSGGDSCDEICEAAGGRCLLAFNDQRDGCFPGGTRRCNNGSSDQICRCAL